MSFEQDCFVTMAQLGEINKVAGDLLGTSDETRDALKRLGFGWSVMDPDERLHHRALLSRYTALATHLRSRLDETIGGLEKLMESRNEFVHSKGASASRYTCLQCGSGGHCDEDGCCVSCGRQLIEHEQPRQYITAPVESAEEREARLTRNRAMVAKLQRAREEQLSSEVKK